MYDFMYNSGYKQFLHRSVETPVVLRPTKMIRVERARSPSVSFDQDEASREAGRPSEDTVLVNSPDLCDRHMLPPLNLDSITTAAGNDTMMAHEEVKRAMRDMVSDQARQRLNTALNELTDDDVKKAYYNKFK